MPPLRDRREDIPLLVHHFVRRHAAAMGREIDTVPGQAMRRLTDYDWPGNVRELENVLERSVILSSGPGLGLPPDFGASRPDDAIGPGATDPNTTLERVEEAHIRTVLDHTGWKIEGDDGAAALLGLKPSTLRSRMKKHGIRRAD